MRRAFFDKWASAVKASPSLLRGLYKDLTEDASSANTSAEAEVDVRVMDFIMSGCDPGTCL